MNLMNMASVLLPDSFFPSTMFSPREKETVRSRSVPKERMFSS